MEIKPNNIHNIDCFEGLKYIPSKSVDLVGKQFLEGTIGCMLVSYYNEEDRFGKPIHKNKSKQRRERRKSQRSNRR